MGECVPRRLTLPAALELVRHPARGRDRLLLGLTGPPGAGKSTVAARLEQAAAGAARAVAVVGMDGFHLDGDTLAARGLASVKGAPETFDADGFVALLRQLRTTPPEAVPVPGFDRAREQTVPAATNVAAATELVIVEGNYLLLDGPWRPVRDVLDQVWFVDVPGDVRVPRLVARHVEHGRSRADAEEWVHRSDEANARLVAAARDRADAVLAVGEGDDAA